ncbi:hypothetical protein I79_019471 [Cricetulus griseus]|uniref:Uncharacterized protein n=1 Tax=Cricetulus griseus TaxID=10029 RepID=G3I7I1_CRIGR|nr:hypothetical protein I79_019471 [Cricetulus griseus]
MQLNSWSKDCLRHTIPGFDPQPQMSQVWWYTHVIPSLRRWWPDDQFKDILGYIVILRTAWNT